MLSLQREFENGSRFMLRWSSI